MKDLIDHLFIDHSVQLSVFPEFISFLAGSKRIIRIVINKSDKSFNAGLFLNNGFFASEVNLFSYDRGNAFGSLLSNVDGIEREHLTPVSMLSISYSRKELLEFEKAEVDGDTEKAGMLLGYPLCCVRKVEDINAYNDLWSVYYLNDYEQNKSADCHTNRFPIAWGGISPIGELFPCSLNCKAAIEYSRNMLHNVSKLGFKRIADTCYHHGRRSPYINKNNGNISLNPLPDYSPIIFS